MKTTNMDLSTVKQTLTRFGRKQLYRLSKHSPEILMVSGTVLIIAGTVYACKQTLNLEKILSNHQSKRDEMEKAQNDFPDEYTEDLMTKDKATLTIQTSIAIARNYIVPAALVVGGIACMFGSYGIMKRRNASLLATCATLEAALNRYREAVKAKLGPEAENDLYHGVEEVDVVNDEKGKKTKEKLKVVNEARLPSPYARYFDKACSCYRNDASLNKSTLISKQKWANWKLQADGFLFLNDVYEELGMLRSSVGQHVGWILDGDGDGYVDFGIFDVTRQSSVDFVNGYEKCILLDFNVDGVIDDKIEAIEFARKR